MTISIEFAGRPPSKKNSQVDRISKAGRHCRTYSVEARKGIDDLILQIPAPYRDMKLEHPDVVFEVWCPDGRGDRDNFLVDVTDALKAVGVIRNDSIAAFNGTITIRPAVKAKEWRTVVTLSEGTGGWN